MGGQASGSASGPTLGIEEELHVLEADTGRLTSRGPQVRDSFAGSPHDGALVLEMTLSQVEAVTAISADVDEVISRAARLRSAAAAAAASHGLALAAAGTPLLGDPAEQLVADDQRYLALRARAAGLVSQQLIAGMHVHLGVGDPDQRVEEVDDDARVAVVDAVRPWLPTLLALTANSPYWFGVDTGFASYRQVHWQRWPVAGPPPLSRDAKQWHQLVADVVATGVVEDASYVYWDVRLASRFPTVEVRVADVQASVQDAATYTCLLRGLAAQALAEHTPARSDRAGWREVPTHVLRAASWRAARYGLDEQLVDPVSATLRPAAVVVRALLDAARPGLQVTGELEQAVEGLRQITQDGNGAQRQRAAFARAGWAGVQQVVRVDAVGAAANAPPRTLNDGNGWVDCACGLRHWGRNGAAGLLILRPGEGGQEVLMQLRSPWTHQGGTWGLPGGARDSHESTAAAARREAAEETGLDPFVVQDVGEHRVDHGAWSYTYVLATAPAQTPVYVANRESDAVEWVPLDDVAARVLHPALALEWPRLRELVRGVRC